MSLKIYCFLVYVYWCGINFSARHSMGHKFVHYWWPSSLQKTCFGWFEGPSIFNNLVITLSPLVPSFSQFLLLSKRCKLVCKYTLGCLWTPMKHKVSRFFTIALAASARTLKVWTKSCSSIVSKTRLQPDANYIDCKWSTVNIDFINCKTVC